MKPPQPDKEQKPSVNIPLDDGTADKVREFLAEKHGDAEAAQVPEPEHKLEPDQTLAQENPDEMMLRSALVDTTNIELTVEEKNLFMKALLTDAPVRLTVKLFNNQLILEFRSRTMYEQKRILDLLRFDITDGILPPDDPAQYITRLQQYCVALMLERVNGEAFSDIALETAHNSHLKEKVLKDAEILRNFYARKLATMGHVRWVGVLNGLRQFEAKCRKCSEEAANENFWTPQGSGSSV